MAPSGGEAGGNKEEREKEGRLAEEGMLVEWDDGPPGTLVEWSSLHNPPLYLEKQREGCRSQRGHR